MFLFAKLVMDNLSSQLTTDEILEELDTFPEGLGAALVTYLPFGEVVSCVGENFDN